MRDETLAVTAISTTLEQPTGFAFVDERTILATEKASGRVRMIRLEDDGAPSDSDAETVLDLAVNSFDERGLLGIAVHPDVASQPFVYLYWTWRGSGDGDEQLLGDDTEEATEVPELGNRVDRFRWDAGEETLTWDREILLLPSNTLQTDTLGRVRGNHDAGPLVFGQDGKLYVTIGDQNLRGQLQNIADGPEPDDAHLAGVVLRLNDDGSAPDDNPFAAHGASVGGEACENVARVWAYGIRNTFGLAVHPATGAIWATENGDDTWDEINILPAGANSGWIQVMGPPDRFEQYRNEEIETEDGLDNPDWPPSNIPETAEAARDAMVELPGSQYVEPVFAWRYPPAVTAIGFVTGDELGAESANTAWLGTVLTNSLIRYPMRADGTGFEFPSDDGLADGVDDNESKGDLGESEQYVAGTGFGVVTAIHAAPNGLLYVTSLTNGALYRIAPSA
jgi:glucose/arabinose dehydrogenase